MLFIDANNIEFEDTIFNSYGKDNFLLNTTSFNFKQNLKTRKTTYIYID